MKRLQFFLFIAFQKNLTRQNLTLSETQVYRVCVIRKAHEGSKHSIKKEKKQSKTLKLSVSITENLGAQR